MFKNTPFLLLVSTLVVAISNIGCQKKGEPVETVSIQGKGASKENVQQLEAPKPAQEQMLDPSTQHQLTLYRKAKDAFLVDDLKTAEEYFLQLAKSEPLSSEKESGIIALAQIYRETGREDQAIPLLHDLRKADPELPEPYFLLGRLYAAKERPEEAIEMYKELLQRQPDYLQARVELGALYNNVGDREKAAETLQDYESKLYAFAKVVENKEAPIQQKLYALSTLALVSDDRASLAFYRALRDPVAKVRFEALNLIANDGPAEAKTVERVTWMSQYDPVTMVRMAAKQTLERLKAMPPLPPDEVEHP